MTSNPAAAFIQASKGLSIDSFPPNSPERVAALEEARALVRRLETPNETAFNVGFDTPILLAALEVARANDVFNVLNAEESRPKSTAELAKHGGGEVGLMRRMLRHLSAMHIIAEVGPDLWASTAQSNKFISDQVFGIVRYGKLVGYKTQLALVDFLAANGYKDTTAFPGNWQTYVGDENANFYNHVMENADLRWAFTKMIEGVNSQFQDWMEFFDTKALLSDVAAEGAVWVDVGGNLGHDAIKVLSKHPELKDRIVVQDQPGLVEEGKDKLKAQGIDMMAHDFFTEQPVKGAKVYFFHTILHDWPDDKGRQILRGIKPAMKKGYSKLLITEMVLPKTGAPVYGSSLDITLLAATNSRERSEIEWTEFLASEGFEIVKFWHGPGTPEGVIEAVLKD